MRHLFFLVLLFPALLKAQTPFKFQWQAKPAIHTVDKKFESSAAVYIQEERINEYIIEKEGLFMYRTVHRLAHLNNDKGIEGFNKIYLPFDEGIDMVDVKARTILPNGQVMELDKSNIKDLKDDDGEYKIFALEGLTKGCEVEYYYTIKKSPSFFGREVLASQVPSMSSRFELIAPKHLVFETKSFNELPVSKESEAGEKRYLVIEDSNIPEAEEEKYSMYKASLKRVEYKLSYNKGKNPQERMFTWNELAKRAFEIYSDINDKDKKKIKDLLNTINPKGSDAEKTTAIENYLKKNFSVREDIPNEDADDLGKVIKDKIASERAIGKLYSALLSAAAVNYQLVLAGDRSDYTIDRNFENWNAASNLLIYIPSTRKFLAPTELAYRYPWIPPTWAATNGLYCVTTTIGNFTTAVGEVKGIGLESTENNYINMDVSMKLDKDETLLMNVKQTYGGYASANYKMPFLYWPAEEQDKLLKDMIKFGTNSENIISHSFENKELEQANPYLPFVINASVKTTNMIERAGEKLILKIGEVIGEQAELYDNKERTTNIELEFPHVLIRNIEFTIPEGYKLKNLEDLNIKEVYTDKEKETMGFESSYTRKGNVLTITIKEVYNLVNYPKSQYENFKKVINAAADFNKVVLVMEKES